MKLLYLLIISFISIFAYSQPAPPRIGSMLCKFYDNGKLVTVPDSLVKFGIWSAQSVPYSSDTVIDEISFDFKNSETMNIGVYSWDEGIWNLNKVIRWDSVPYNSGNILSGVYSFMVMPYKTDDSIYVDSMYYQSGYFNLVPLVNTPKLKQDGKSYTECVLVKHPKSDSLISDYTFNNAKKAGDFYLNDKAWKLAKYYYLLALEYKPNDKEMKARVKELDKLISENK